MLVSLCGGVPVAVGLVLLLTICVIFLEAKKVSIRRTFATKSRYSFYDKGENFETPETCKPIHINMVFRHGTRYPSTKDIWGMVKLSEDINQFYNKDTPVKYRELTLPWTSRFLYGDKMLSRTGGEEMYNISKRLLERFPILFSHRYFGEKYYFVSTATPRSSQSASAFAFGLFEGKGYLGPLNFQPISMVTTNLTDPVLRFFDTCPEYEQKITRNKEVSLAEFYKFQNGLEMEQVKKRIVARLNISGLFNITTTHVQHMFLSCAYEVAIYGKGGWCSVFEEDDLDIVEYLYDIKYYWKRGYGHKINYKISCLLLKNLTGSIQEVVNAVEKSESHTHAIFHFSHAETVIPLLCIMGLFNDTEPLLASNYERQKDRLFQSSNMAPFSGNVAVVLYSCKQDDENSKNPPFYVQVLVNEKVAALPCCNSKDLCPLQQFLACFGDIEQWCNLSKICKHAEGHVEL